MRDQMFDGDLATGSMRRALRLIAQFMKPNLGRVAILVLLALGMAALNAALPWLVSVAVDSGLPAARRSEYGGLLAVGAAIGVSGLVLAVFNLFWRGQAGWIGQYIVFNLRERLFSNFLRQPIRFYDEVPAGSLISRLTADMEWTNALFGTTLARFLQIIVTLAATVVAMLMLNAGLAAITFMALAPSGLLIAWSVVKLHPPFAMRRAALTQVSTQVVEYLDLIQIVQAFRRERHNDLRFAETVEPVRVSDRRIESLRALHKPLRTLILSLTTIAIVTYGGYLVASGDLQIGVLSAFVLYMAQLFGPVLGIVTILDAAQRAMVSLAKIAEAIAMTPAMGAPEELAELRPQTAGEMRFEDVSFSYGTHEGLERPAVSDLRFTLSRGETVALLGRTGAGKSTIAKLMARFYDPSAGRITLDGTELLQIPESDLRRRVLLLNQENFLFSGSIWDNVRIGNLSATQEEIEAAASRLGVHRLISALPKGYDTEVGKRGTALSAGQRQLVSLTQAYLMNPAVLILDEATSSLDLLTERAIQGALRTLMTGRTGVIIAHRMTTVEIANRALVISAGRIVMDRALDGDLAIDEFRQFFWD